MTGRALVALPYPEMRATVIDFLREGVWPAGTLSTIEQVRDQGEVREAVARTSYDLLCVDAHLPDTSNSGAVHERQALGLLRDIRQGAPSTALVVLTPVATEELFQCVQDVGRCRLVLQSGPEWSDRLVRYARELLANSIGPSTSDGDRERAQPETNPTRVTLEIKLDLERRTWTYAFQGKGTVPFDYSDSLVLSPEEMKGLVGRSKRLAKRVDQGDQQWREELQDIGRVLWQELFFKNPMLLFRLGRAVERAKGIEHCRLRFVVEREIHPLILEAVHGSEGQHWMLEGPVVRGINLIGSEYPLFVDAETRTRPINVLIIEADVQGVAQIPVSGAATAAFEEVDLPRLKNVSREAAELEQYLRAGQSQLGIGRIRRIAATAEEWEDFERTIETVVAEGPWHVVHYAGHSHYSASNRAGYVFIPGPGGQGVSAVPASIFRHWLKSAQVRFVYLSSCHSSEDDFVFELARAGVPSMLGFRWDIEDPLAAEHAGIFYRSLFERRQSLEHAFLETRRRLHGLYEKDRIWAAPILILQVG